MRTSSSSLILVCSLVLGIVTIGASPVRGFLETKTKSALLSYGKASRGVSIELSDAPQAPTAQERVSRWLLVRRHTFARYEKQYRVSRLAIAAAISYEALEDVAPLYIPDMVHWSGPGKVHYKEYRLSEGDPVAKQVETIGLLPRVTMQHRSEILSTPPGAIMYIAAIMHAYDAKMRATSGEDIACNVPVLLALYTTSDLRNFPSRSQLLRIEAQTPAATWARENATLYASAGKPAMSICK